MRLADHRLILRRALSSVAGLLVVWVTVLAFAHSLPVDLTVALLVVLAEVLAVAVASGPVLAVMVALIAVFIVNWYLVPPYGTFAIASADNVVALAVFTLVASVAAALVEAGARARAREEVSARQASVLGDIVVARDGDDTTTALERIRRELRLDRVDLVGPTLGGTGVVATAGQAPATRSRVVDVELPDGFRLVGQGPELFAPDPAFLTSLGSAAVLAFESERLDEEQRRVEELASIDRARTALLASVGHDLRTPLAGLRVSVDTLRSADATLSESDRVELLSTISDATDRLDELITNLLDMSRLEAGAVLAHPVATDLGDVIAQVVIGTPTTGRVVVDVPDDLPAVAADPQLLERMIANLVSNALRYSPSGTPVTVRARSVGAEAVLLEVEDHGPGLPSDQREAVFRPFHRVGGAADGGSGLGLAIVRGFGDAMGIEVALRPGYDGGLVAELRARRWSPS